MIIYFGLINFCLILLYSYLLIHQYFAVIDLDFGHLVWARLLDFEFQNSIDHSIFLDRLAFQVLEFHFTALGLTLGSSQHSMATLRFHLRTFLVWMAILSSIVQCLIGLSA